MIKSTNFHVILPNDTNYTTKGIKRFRRSSLEKKEKDYKDGSGLQFIKIDFVTGDQEIKLAILVEI